jgi:hypothetical protein
MIGLLLRLGAVTLVFAALLATVMVRTDTVVDSGNEADAATLVSRPEIVKAPIVTPAAAPEAETVAAQAAATEPVAPAGQTPSASRSIAALVGPVEKSDAAAIVDAKQQPALAFAEPAGDRAAAVDAIMPDSVEASAADPSLAIIPMPVPDPRTKLRKKFRNKN